MNTGSGKKSFVFAVCGESHATRLNVALRYLKRFSRADIIVVKSRIQQKLDCDQVIDCEFPPDFDDHRASIFLKTSLHRTLAGKPGKSCYIDSDVIAVNDGVDGLFDLPIRPVLFAQDLGNLSRFSRYAVNCGCAREECWHLPEAIYGKFGVSVTGSKHWNHWNGGVFVFDQASAEFLETWHRYTLAAFDDPYWKTRDQGTLVATVWKMGLQDAPNLPREYNCIVDRYKSIPQEKRKSIEPADMPVDESYSLAAGDPRKPRPSLIHFINGGVGTRGWKNWDDAARLLKRAKAPRKTASPKRGGLSADNRVVHGLWIGSRLSKMELLTLASFLRQGHEFHLWTYDPIETPLPEGVILEDGDAILPRERIQRKAEVDPESGVGKGSVSPFSDLFRYKLLYEKGGWWADMDVTCLKPLAFDAPYVFRAHRVGVVGNIMKCPPKSPLMRELFARLDGEVNPHSPWLMTNRALSDEVRRQGLAGYILDGCWNRDTWEDVGPLALGEAPIPEAWVAVHWINEFWRTLKASGGVHLGRRLYAVAPDQERPAAGSALARLYGEHGLADSATAAPEPAPLNVPARRQPPAPPFFLPSHVNMLVASLARGGAERIVLETLAGLKPRGSTGKLFVLHEWRPCYPAEDLGNVKVHRLHALDPAIRMQAVAAEVLASPEPWLYTHLIGAGDLMQLWERGVKTVPVVHNTRESWRDPPALYNHAQVPFVVAVSEHVARQLREDGCARRIVVIRHELQRWFSPEEQEESRRLVRERHGIAERTLLVGMVGEFKSQRAYTRAVRVLAELQRHQRRAKLMILGGWDHDWGHGRQSYTATQSLAVELGVTADLLVPGSVADPERHYAAFDVYLNTSVHDGLSISLLEAIQAGCPVVTADVGGNREMLPEKDVLVKDPADIAAYVDGIRKVSARASRTLAPQAPDHDLVPRLWCWMGRYGRRDSLPPLESREGTLFLTDNLNIGGAQRSLVNLLSHYPGPARPWLCVLDTVYGEGYQEPLEAAEVPVLSVHTARDYMAKLERVLELIERLKVRNVCLWNVDPRIKLLLAKVFPAETLRLVDVSPGPMLFEEMEQARVFQRRIAFGAEDYWARLDHFVAKYSAGAPSGLVFPDPKLAIIPNGVPVPDPGPVPAPEGAGWPGEADPEFLIGTACRLTPGKRIEFLIDVMAELARALPAARLVIAGGVDPRHADYWPKLQEHLRARGVANVHFLGPRADVTPMLRRLKAFVMLADTPGCPNASLEAMVLGVPVIANAAGGTGEQVSHGENGFLVSGTDPAEMAARLRELLTDPALHRRFSEAALKTARQRFSMQAMVDRYRHLLDGTPLPSPLHLVTRSGQVS